MKRKPIATSISTVVFSLLLTGCQSVSAPEAILPVPQEKQVNWQKRSKNRMVPIERQFLLRKQYPLLLYYRAE